jgi:hypothetical protein
MSGTNKIILLPSSPIFNKEVVPGFEKFSKEDTVLLYSTLFQNNKDNLSKLNGNFEKNYYFDEKDKDYLPGNLFNDGENPYFINTGRIWDSISKILSKQIDKDNTCVLIIFSHSIGLSQNKINKLFNLLNYDDNNIMLGKTPGNKLSFIGLNFFSENLFMELSSSQLKYNEILRQVNKAGCFLFTLNGYLTVENICDFRELYKILSKKESIEFCCQDIHEQFTHLFIEYKECCK